MSVYFKKIGLLGEQKALDYLKKNQFLILKKNFRNRFGEIDIIAKKEKTIYFIEVKTRSNINKGYPYQAVNQKKIDQIKYMANFFLLKNKYKNYKLKIGVISIVLNQEIKFYQLDQ